MDHGSRRLTKLPATLQAQVRSSVQISSLNDVILGLVKNSLDADAGDIQIRVDFLRGHCSASDDGHGILPDDFGDNGGLAQLYYTSRTEQTRRFHGAHGRFLSSLSAISLLSITSCTAGGAVSSAILRDGKRLSTDIDTKDELLGDGRSGTRVVVHDLFGNMPVRVKDRLNRLENHSELDREFRGLKTSLTALILATPRLISIDVRSTQHRYTHRPSARLDPINPDKLPFDLDYIASTLFQAGLVGSPVSSLWRKAASRTPCLSLEAAINLQPAPSKNAQFISLNQHPLTAKRFRPFFDQINSLFDSSSFGTDKHDQSDNSDREPWQQQEQSLQKASVKRPSGGSKRVDRWPVFYIRMELESSPEVETTSDRDADQIITLTAGVLQMLVVEFLHSNGFRVSKAAEKGMKSKRKRSHLTKTSNAPVGNQTFNAWSRVKSANGTPKDLLAGLPFSVPKRQKPEPVQDTSNRPFVPFEIRDPEEIQWTNAQTSNSLRIDPRTGTVLSTVDGGIKPVSSGIARPRACADVCAIANNLRSKALLHDRVEEPLKSITPKHYASMTSDSRGFDSGSVDALQAAGPLSACGPVSAVDPVCASISKEILRTAKTLGQVDGKFVLASTRSLGVLDTGPGAMLVLIDQHAADERVKVENLFRKLCSGTAIALACPIVFEVGREETLRFKYYQAFFASWNVNYLTVSSDESNQIRVLALPELIAERCRLEPRLLVELLRKEIWQDRRTPATRHAAKVGDWTIQIGNCPQGLLDILTSRACRTAVMFNDVLTVEQCKQLISQLGDCLFPFQCAHGRPSLTTIAHIRDVGTQESRVKDSTFGQAWKAWMGE